MAAIATSVTRPRRSSFIALVIVTAVLYLAGDVLVPLAVAILLSFLLAPAVRRLERWKFGRVASTLSVASLAFGVILAVSAIAAMQAVSLAAKLPEYRQNIVKKIHALRHPDRRSTIGKAAEAIKDIEKQAAPERPPMPVKETPASSFEALAQFLAPVAKPATMTLAVIVFTILFLLNREAMRERLIGLLGTARMSATTRAMGEASYRVSRYLGTQFVVNAMFGVPFGIALWLIGIPNALLFGLLGMVLRFVPYVGVWIAVIGRHIPEFGYLNMLLGVDPVLSPDERFYQRLLALDREEAAKLIEQHAAVHGAGRTFDDVIIPALSLAEIDRRKGALEPARERYVY